jgi:hypothetical protein
MRAKVPSADSAELEAVVVAIRSSSLIGPLVAPLIATLVVVLGACTVDLSEKTVGAKKSCLADAGEIKTFICGPFKDVILGQNSGNTGCRTCHSVGAAGGNAMIFSNAVSAGCCGSGSCPDPADPQYAAQVSGAQSDICTVFAQGDRIYTYPQTQDHSSISGNALYTSSQLQTLINWVTENVN